MLKQRLTIPLIVTALIGGASGVQASGTYPPAPPRLRADITKEIDPAAYNLGKLIFAGKAKLNGATIPAEVIRKNRETLNDVIGKIPDRAREQLSVETLAAQLNQDETDALLYYLQLRFRVEEVTA
tara:strand:+ start:17 stop:394 length:378 start_codon:yes stop_codon:yes gene_type:complete